MDASCRRVFHIHADVYKTVATAMTLDSESPRLAPPHALDDEKLHWHHGLCNSSESCPSQLHLHKCHDNDFVTGADQRRWALVKDALIRYPVLTEHKGYLALAHEVGGESCLHLRPDHLVASYIKNWPSNDLLRSVDGLIVGMVLWLANFCYGGIHAAAWNDHFPSEPEKWLWRASASYIGFCGGLWVVLNLLVAKYQRLNDFWEHWMDGKKSWWQSFALGTVVGVCGVSLFLARFYIVLEAFVSIRRMPLSAYQTPEWTDILPHF